jgi:hypothetical protein
MTDPSRISRRKLLLGAGATVAAATVGGVARFAIGGAPSRTVARRAPGYEPWLWDDPRAWANGRVPGPNEVAVVSSPIVVEGEIRVGGVIVEPDGALVFAPSRSTLLESAGNVIVHGKLIARPVDHSVTHTLRFADVDENAFLGANPTNHTQVLDTDVGLWVTGHGSLDLHGAPKTAWSRAAGSIAAGSTTFNLEEPPIGWRVGDEIVITPTIAPLADHSHATAYDGGTLTAISGRTVTIDRATKHPHPRVTVRPGISIGAEVLNLSRNVVLGGTESGRAHVMIVHAHAPQSIAFVRLEHVGPANHSAGFLEAKTGAPAVGPVNGRYGLHFHHCFDGSEGSKVEGVVITKCGNRGFVPHMSDGIHFLQCIAHDTRAEQFWWDWFNLGGEDTVRDPSNRVTYERCVGSLLTPYFGVKRNPDDPIRNSVDEADTFAIIRGDDNRAIDCVAVGNRSWRTNLTMSAGFHWPNPSRGVWPLFAGCVSHNNATHGIRAWQNTDDVHPITRFLCYHNSGAGIEHGAYHNNYTYEDGILYGNLGGPVSLHANSRRMPPRLTFRRCWIDASGMTDYSLYGGQHSGGVFAAVKGSDEAARVLFDDCDFVGARRASVGHWLDPQVDSREASRAHWDFVGCRFDPAVPAFRMGPVHAKSEWRVHDSVNGKVTLTPVGEASTWSPTWRAFVAQGWPPRIGD